MIGNRLFLFAGLVILLSSCTTYQVDAATYKWTDNKGQVNHSPMPPGGIAYSTLMPQAPSKAIALKNAQEDMSLIQQHNCQESKDLFHALEQSHDENDNQKEREGNMAKIKEDIRKYCP